MAAGLVLALSLMLGPNSVHAGNGKAGPVGTAPPPGIAGRDDRTPDLGPLAAYRKGMGRLLVPVGGQEMRECTAFCVGRQWIMTAAHCLAGLAKVPRRARFVPDANEADERHKAVAMAWPRHESEAWNAVIGGVAFPVAASRRSIRPEKDWVALPLNAPACGMTLPILPVRASALAVVTRRGRETDGKRETGRDVEFAVLAHHGDAGHVRLLRSARCGPAMNPDARRLRRHLSADVILHDCDLAFGASGSPLFLRLPYGRYGVVGMNVAIFERNRARIGRLARGPLAGEAGGREMRGPGDREPDDGFVANMAVSAAAFGAVVVALHQEGPPLTDQRAIASLQRLLRARGLDPGPIDGMMGPRTRKALIAYRRSQGMEPVALASSMVLEVLRDTTVPSAGFARAAITRQAARVSRLHPVAASRTRLH